jgi:ribosomal protein S18 acetylase RimI-like enzyme
MNYTIRPAGLQDVPGIASVAFHTWNITYAHSVAPHNRQEFLAQTYAPQRLGEAITQAHSWFYVATQAKMVVGFVQYERRFDAEGELVRIYIHPDHQRQGIGRAFLGAGLAAMASAGISDCYVSAEISNAAARAFYERFGFRLQREYGHFLGDQIIQLVEYMASIASVLDGPNMKKVVEKVTEQMQPYE